MDKDTTAFGFINAGKTWCALELALAGSRL
jgi:hypothetical protein